MKWELEELGFRYYDPHAYQQIANLLVEKRDELETYLTKVSGELQTRLRLEGSPPRYRADPSISTASTARCGERVWSLTRSTTCAVCVSSWTLSRIAMPHWRGAFAVDSFAR